MVIKKILLGLAVLGLGSLVGTSQASAASQPTGLTVSPAFQLVTIPAGAVQQPVSFSITNDRSVAQTIAFSVRDFNSLNESGGLFFVGTNPTELQKKYGLAKWVSLSEDSLTLQPKQTITLNASILNLPDLSPGGHYGALMIALGGGGTGGGQVGLQPIASSLLFVTKPQGATYGLSLSRVDFRHSWLKLPASVSLNFQNTGNTHVIPRGIVYLRDSGGKVIQKGIINQNSNLILPQANRLYSVALPKAASVDRPGKYSLRVDFRFDGINQYRSYQTSFWYLPLYIWLIAAILVVGLVGFIVLVRRKLGLKKPAQ